jgi:predicted enzyme related to lactoylglutathione lyase
MPKKVSGGVFYGPMVVCEDFARSFRFYHETLGLKTEVDGSPPWAEFQSDGVRLVLLERGFWSMVHGPSAPPSPNPTGGTVAFAVQVNDVEATYRRMVKAGAKFETTPTDRPMMGVRSAFTRDPDGNLVELTSKLAKSP